MVRASVAAFSWASGELSELMYGRRDFARYQNGARALRGFIALPEGPVTRLPGTRFMGLTAGNVRGRLMSFVFSEEDAVLLEWTANLLRFWRQGALVEVASVPYSIATPYSLARLANLKHLQSSDRIYLTEGSKAPRRLSRMAIDNWVMDDTPFVGGPFASRNLDQSREVSASGISGSVTLTASADIWTTAHVGTRIKLTEIQPATVPYWAGQVAAVIGTEAYYDGKAYRIVAFGGQTGPTGVAEPVVVAGSPPGIAADGDVIWTWVAAGNPMSAPARANLTAVSLGARRFFATANLTAEVAGFISTPPGKTTGVNPPTHSEGYFLTDADGPVWAYLHDGTGTALITAFGDARHVTATVDGILPASLVTQPTYRWSEAAWSDTRGWPAAIGAFEQRHFYGGTSTEPRTIWASVAGGTTDMTAGANDDDGFTSVLPSAPQNIGAIRWILGLSEYLYIGTSADEVVGRSTNLDQAFGFANSRFTIESSEGVAVGAPVVVENLPVFIDKSGTKLLSANITELGRLRPDALTQIARHILAPEAEKIVLQTLPVQIVWAVLADGDLVGLTFTPSQQVVGFHRHNLGGNVEDIEVLPSDDGLTQHLWLVVRRVLDGVVNHCVERMEHPFVDLDGGDAVLADAWHLFAARRYQGAAVKVLTAIVPHLVGETVVAWTEFGAFEDLVVAAGGTVTLPRAVTSAIVGIDKAGAQRFDTLDIQSGQPDGGDDGRNRTHRATGLRLHRTGGGTMSIMSVTGGVTTAGEARPLIQRRALQDLTLLDGVIDLPGGRAWGQQVWQRFRPEPGAPLTIMARTATIMATDD